MYMYYISHGSKTMMYTLRLRYDEVAVVEGENIIVTLDVYVRNLSIDPIKAVEKAKEYIELNDSNAELSETELVDLEEIRRSEAGAVAALRAEREREYEEARIARELRLFETINDGIWPFGRHSGSLICNAPNDYALFWIKKESELTENDCLEAFLIAKVKEAFPHLANMPVANGEYFGEIGKRLDFTATVTEKFFYESFFGYRVQMTAVVKMIKDSGELLVYMGSGDVSNFDIGETVTFKATIKGHEEYKGEKQTKLARIKV